MHFKDFISRQRVTILVVGIVTFFGVLIAAYHIGYASLESELFINLSASAFTIVFTSLIIDYLGLREEKNRTKNVAGLAEDEITATCFRVKWRMARLFGLERRHDARDNISSRQEAKAYLERAELEVDNYLNRHDLLSDQTPLQPKLFPKYLERLEIARTELEQTLLLYEYAMDYSLREGVLSLRRELQVADNILSFIDVSDELNQDNISLIRVLSKSVFDGIESVLGHDSRVESGSTISDKDNHRI